MSRIHKPIVLTQFQKEIIIGALLGDGTISKNTETRNSRFTYNSKSDEHVRFVCSTLEEYAPEGGLYQRAGRFDERTGKTYYSTTFYTEHNQTFSEIRDKWYINGVKHIPKDLILTPTICLIWYLGDGNLRKYNKNDSQRICLATNCFKKEELEKIILPQLKSFEPYLVKQKENYLLYIPRRCVSAFLSYIGPCPVQEYEYKWDYKEYRWEAFKNKKELIPKIKIAFEHGATLKSISDFFDVCENTARNWLRKEGYKTDQNKKNYNSEIKEEWFI